MTLKEIRKYSMLMHRTNWDFIVTGYLNNTYGRASGKLNSLKNRLEYYLSKTSEDIQRSGGNAVVQSEQQLHIHCAAIRYVIALLETKSIDEVSRIHHEHDQRCRYTEYLRNFDRAMGRGAATSVDSFYRFV